MNKSDSNTKMGRPQQAVRDIVVMVVGVVIHLTKKCKAMEVPFDRKP